MSSIKGGRDVMKKILKKTGAFFTGIIIGIKSMIIKVYAVNLEVIAEPEYGIPEPEPKTNSLATNIIIPIILLIGIIVFCKKSTSSVLKKVIVSAVVVIAYILIRFLFL